MNRPHSKNYRRDRRAKRSNPLFVWLFVLVAMLIMVPIQAAEEKQPKEAPVQQVQPQPETPAPEEDPLPQQNP